MSVKEFLSKYKLYTILAVVVAVLMAAGVTLGVLLSRDTTPPADALTGNVYIMKDGTVASADNYDFALDIYYSSESATVCRLDSVTRNSTSSATTIVIPETVTINGTSRTITTTYNSYSSSRGVFYPVRSIITEVSLPNTIANIGRYAFYGCDNLTTVTIGSGVTSILEDAFRDCTSLTSIEVDENNQSYKDDNGVLYTKDGTRLMVCPARTTLTEYNILDTTTTIDDEAFYGCSSITTISIPASVTSIGSYAFSGCSSLTSINIPDGVTSIEYGTFYACSSLPFITIPSTVTSISHYAFQSCTSLTSITIPSSVTSILEDAFPNCSSLTSIEVDGNNLNYKDDNGVLYTKDGTRLMVCPAGTTLTEYNILDTTTTIDDEAFYDCTNLTSITIPSSVTSIEWRTFGGCSSLTTINIPSSVTRIEGWAFRDCTSLTTINIPSSVTSIGSSAFYGCDNLTTVTIGSGVTSIGEDAFYGCDNLTTVTIGSGVTSIGSSAFGNCSSLTSINIPDSVTSIGRYAFRDCSSLTSINIPDGVTSIENGTFLDCSSLSSITIPSTVTSIGSSAFSGCSSLTNVYFYNDITSNTSMIGSTAFYGNNSNVTYWFKDQTSLDNAIAIDAASTNKFAGSSNHSNFQLMIWNVSVNCNENFGTLSYTEPDTITYGTEITATVTPNPNAEFLYWEVKVTQNGNEIASDQIASTTLNYTITDFGTYTFTAVFDFNILITSESGGTEFDITRETNDGIVYTYSIKMKDGYSLNRIALISTDDIISSTDYQDAPATENYLNTNGFCTGFHYIVNDNGTELILEIVNITAPFIVYLGF